MNNEEKILFTLERVCEKIALMEEDVATLKRSVIIIENDHGKKLDALFDGQQMNSEKLDRIEKEVTRHDDILVRNAL